MAKRVDLLHGNFAFKRDFRADNDEMFLLVMNSAPDGSGMGMLR